MSLAVEKRGISREAKPSFAIESLDDIPDGFIFPLSVAIGQNGSMRLPPYPEDIYKIIHDIFDCLPQWINTKINNRGSTLPYVLLMTQSDERRGPINYVIFNNMRDDLQRVRGSRIWNVLTQLPFGSDTDLFIEGTDRSNFEEYKRQTMVNIRRNMAHSRNQKIVEKRSTHQTGTTQSLLTRIEYWLTSINGLRHPKPFESKRQAVAIDVKQADIFGIPFMDMIVRHTPLSIDALVHILKRDFDFTDDQIFQRIGNVYFAIGDWRETNPADSPLEDRRDPHYSLSWDASTFGTVSKFEAIDPDLRARILKRTHTAHEMNQDEKNLGKQRTTFVEGVAPPRYFGQKLVDEYYFQFPKESLQALCTPITVGQGLYDLSATRQFLLALRAAQKGAMYEDLLQLTPEGKEALKSDRRAKAISPEALEMFNRISIEEFQKEIAGMTPEERRGFSEYIMKYMLTGLFYPQKFLGYALETGIFKFFPNMSGINENNIDGIINQMSPWEEYIRKMHEVVFFDDNSPKGKNWIVNFLEECQNRVGFENPYISFVKALFGEQVIPLHVDTTYNYLPTLDALLELDQEQIDRQVAKYRDVFGNSDPTTRLFSFHTLKEYMPRIARGKYDPNKLKLYELEVLLEKSFAPVFKILGILGTGLFVKSIIVPDTTVWESFWNLNLGQSGLILGILLDVVAGKRKFQIKQIKKRLKNEQDTVQLKA